jgi:Tfp pilus assembly protein PilF
MTLTNRTYRWLAGTLVACALLSSTLLVLGQNTSTTSTDAILVAVAGKVDVSPQGTTQWMPGKANQPLKLGDRLRTGKSSRATLRLSNLSMLRVYELTTLEIQPPEKAGNRSVLNLESGAAYFFNRDKPSETQFRTPSASGAIRGTEFNLSVKPNGRMELALLDGQVDLTNAQGTLQVQTGQEAIAEPGQPLKKVPLIDAVNIIQWTLYYPAILDPKELDLSDDSKKALGESLDAYNSGNLIEALAKYGDHSAGTDAEKVYNASLLLAVGEVDAARQLLQGIPHDGRPGALANALQEMIAAVKGQPWNRTEPRTLATEWLAGSYSAQAARKIDAALDMAKHAAEKDPGFGFAQERLAEMEFSVGDTDHAMAALDKSLSIAPHNAQALALKGFALAAQKKISEAKEYFDKAIAADGSVANGFLGRGLVQIRQGHVNKGRQDLETAASIEPNRAFFRSYLGKAWSLDQPFQYSWNTHLATNELGRAMTLDPKDPTAWLYAALLNDQMNCINQAISDLEHSEDLNGNRAVYRSKFLLDQDAAVRSANLALIYEDAGLGDVAVREATKSLDSDYANYSAHLFLSETYDALQDPKREDLRYQTPWQDELLVANLLAPVGAGVLSQNISQSEYSQLFEADRVGVISQTEFQSRGAWLQNSSEFGTYGPMAFAIEQYYYSDPGWRPNNYIQNSDYDIKLKYQITPKDTAFLQVERSELQTGDPFQYYNFNTPRTPTTFGYDPGLEEYEQQDPNILAGFRHDWGTGQQTLFLYRGLQDHFSSIDPNYYPPIVPAGAPPGFPLFSIVEPSVNNIQRQMELNSFELQHIYESDMHSAVIGGRYQNESMQTASTLSPASLFALPEFAFPSETTHFDRLSAYGYYTLKLGDGFRMTGGLTYDWEHYPVNLGQAPLTSQETDKGRLSPKFGIDYIFNDGTRLRAAFTRSMGGLINDSSTTIEPTEVAGFNQSFRSLIPQSAGFGTPPALTFETYGVGLDHKFETGTYVDLEAELLSSHGSQDVGSYFDAGPGSQVQSQLVQSQYFQEKDVFASISQLIGKDVSVGARYQLTSVDLTADFYSPNLGAVFPQHLNSTLNETTFFGNLYLPCGFFGKAEMNWWSQYNTLNAIGASEGDTGFWQANFYAGYRFPRRHIEAELGLLNAFNHGYNIDPVTYFLEQARTRTLVASLKFNF